MFATGRYVLAHITLFPLKIALIVVELSSYTDKLLTYGRTGIHGAYREINISCNGLSLIPYRSETLIAVPSSTITLSRLNRKYNICIFTEITKYMKADFL